MSARTLAIANCRVSSDEQLKNNSLNKQRGAVFDAAKRLEATIPPDSWWSGSVSSKRGGNLKRKDILEMLEYCKKHPRVKYLIIDEPDRFMRSIDEAMYLEMEFKLLGVKVWYASDDDLNNDDLVAKMMKFMKYYVAEGSNEERQRKSINGQVQALKEGRYTFHPKPGYIKGHRVGVHEIDPIKGPILKNILIRIANHYVTPSQGLVELNKSEFREGRQPLKMDKFRIYVTDPYYAGIVEIHKQVNYRNENGLHDPLISKEQHAELLRIMSAKKKNQNGPRKNGNPKYPCNNIINHTKCKDARYGRVVGFDNDNGKNKQKIYEKYRCRACGEYWHRNDIHEDIKNQFKSHPISREGVDILIEALSEVWTRKEGEAAHEANRLSRKLDALNMKIRSHVMAAIDPDNALIKEEILASIDREKNDAKELESEISKIRQAADDDYERFMRFAFSFLANMGDHFLDPDLLQENRLRCKQIIFPGGFWIDENKKVYTPEISPLVRLASNKKDFPYTEKSFMVRVTRL